MEPKRKMTLKWKLLSMFLLAWLLPVLMILGAMGGYISTNLGTRTAENLEEQLALNVRMCGDRLDSAIEASRVLSYDPTIKNAYAAYRAPLQPDYATLYRTTQNLIDRQYRADSRFRFVVFFYRDSPYTMNTSTFNESAGTKFEQVKHYWAEDHEAAFDLSRSLGTSIAFLHRGEELYLIRNVMDQSYRPIGTVVMALNLPYYFENLTALPWAAGVTAEVDRQRVALPGEILPPAEELGFQSRSSAIRWEGRTDSWLYAAKNDGEYGLSALVKVDFETLLTQSTGYWFMLTGMGLLLVLILIFFFHFFQKQVSVPIQQLSAGAEKVENGDLGYHLDYQAQSREFDYLTEAFNRMSGQLEYQFNHIFEEELALRDARIKALQSHINPHFLNNTLEIINWQARLDGNAKVSKMIEALSTVLDAAIDRDKRPEVHLGEEMAYVSSYLYIIGERFGKRLTVTQDIAPETLARMVPRLILQPIIENAVEHGMGPAGEGEVVIRAYLEGETLILEIENTGVLSPEDRAHITRLLGPDYDTGGESSKNIGISNVNQRLHILCGAGSGLSIVQKDETRVIARLVVAKSDN
ncbi:MAG: histidine kinase [Oscillospiraceae bacterium]